METWQIYEITTRRFLAPIQSLLEDPTVSEVMVNGPSSIYFERQGRIHRSDCHFPDELALLAAARNIAEYVGRRVDGDDTASMAVYPTGRESTSLSPPPLGMGCV